MVSKEEYLNYMQGSGYETSPIYQQGVERWDPTGGIMGVGGKMAEGFRSLKDAGGANFLNQFISTKHSPESGAELYPYPDYTPGAWEPEFGHEISHGGWEYDTNLEKIKSEYAGGEREGGEETFNYLHDLMYGGDYGKDASINFLRRNKLYGYLPVKGKYPGMKTDYIQRTRGKDLLPKAYDAIKNSGLVDWQKGMMMQGPTTAAGQIALGQRPDQVRSQGEAYMDPDRGSYTAPTMTQQGMREEATRTGGTVNPHEATRAVSRPRGPHGYQAGGSVNPFEETRQAARDWSPREQYISRSNLPPYRATPSDNVPDLPPYRATPSDNVPDYFLTSKPSNSWKPVEDRSWQDSGILGNTYTDSWKPVEDQSWQNLGILGNFNLLSGWGQGLLKRFANIGSLNPEKDLEILEELDDSGSKGWLDADWDLDIGSNRFGIKGTWEI